MIDGVLEAENLRMNVPSSFLPLFQHSESRSAANKILAPLQRDGIDQLSVRQGNDELERFTKEDLPSFAVTSEAPVLSESVVRQFLVINTSRFSAQSRQWRFNDGNKINTYKMNDDNFINSVMRREVSITAGDIYECEVRITQRLNPKGEIVGDLEIERVISRRPPVNLPTQTRFDI